MTRFDDNIFLNAIPSFYRNHMGTADREFLATVWETLTRITEAEYASLFQQTAANKLRDAPVLTLYPWVQETFGSWTSRGVSHQHSIVRRTLDDDVAADQLGVFYLGRYIDPESSRFYVGGTRIEPTAQTIITNKPNPSQLSGVNPMGTRIEFWRPDGSGSVERFLPGAPDDQLVVHTDRELFVSEPTLDGATSTITFTWPDIDAVAQSAVVDDSKLTIRLYGENLSLVGITVPAGEKPEITFNRGFLVGDILEFTRGNGHVFREVVSAAGTTYQVTTADAVGSGDTDVAKVIKIYDIPLNPSPFTIQADRITSSVPLPGGTRVRVKDQNGAQAFTLSELTTTILLDREIDPSSADLFLYGFNVNHIDITESSIDFGRAPTQHMVLKVQAPYKFAHDHARYSFVNLQPVTSVALPADRPLALLPDLRENPRYPVRVYHDGVLVDSTDYSFASTTQIDFTFELPDASRVDVVYEDGEENEDHVHFIKRVETLSEISAVTMSEAIEADRYPVNVEAEGWILAADGNVDVNISTIVQLDPPIAASPLWVDAATRGLNWRTTLTTRTEELYGYRGTLASGDKVQDGVDSPTIELTVGDQVLFDRQGETTVVESSYPFITAWIKNALVDEHQIENNFGQVINYLDGGETTERYRRVVLSLYAAYLTGSQVETLENFSSIVLGSDYASKEGRYKGITTQTDGSRLLSVETPQGEEITVALTEGVSDRLSTSQVPLFFAGSAHCTIIDRDLSGIPYLAFFAEALSDDYKYAKRLDVRSPRVWTSTPTAFDDVTDILEDTKADFIELEVWPNDLVKLETTGDSNGGVVIAPSVVWTRVVRVLDKNRLEVTVDLAAGGWGWGEPDETSSVPEASRGWGSYTGWGGSIVADDIGQYTIWTRETRRLDKNLFLDEMLDSRQALAEGETIQWVNSQLAELLKHHIFVAKVAWYSSVDTKALQDFKFFLDTAKSADTGYFAYTEVNDESGIADEMVGELKEIDLTLEKPVDYAIAGYGFVGTSFISPTTATKNFLNVSFDSNWWLAYGDALPSDEARIGGEDAAETGRFVTVM